MPCSLLPFNIRLIQAPAALLALGLFAVACHQPAKHFSGLSHAFPARMPQRVVWAWEEPEDLHTLPPSVGVAYLAETLVLSGNGSGGGSKGASGGGSDRGHGTGVTILSRRQPLRPAPSAPVMAVIRIETARNFVATPTLADAVAAHVGQMVYQQAQSTGLRAVQIDFDATVSQRPFYADLLRQLHPQLPAGMPLSITALVSWCGERSWLHDLPPGQIDEAVPMFFRMGGPRALAGSAGAHRYTITEPLCRGSFGLSLDEPWPSEAADGGTRIYLFAPSPWLPKQLAAVAGAPLQSLAKELSQ